MAFVFQPGENVAVSCCSPSFKFLSSSSLIFPSDIAGEYFSTCRKDQKVKKNPPNNRHN